VKDVNAKRQVKYLSKAYRHAANGTDATAGKYHIHNAAISMFTSFLQGCDDPDLMQTVQSTIRVHKARKEVLEVVQAYSNREYERALQKVDDANEIAESVPQTQFNTQEVDLFEKMAQARLRANEGAFSVALGICENTSLSDRRLDALESLLRLKQNIQEGNVNEAASVVAAAFDEGTAIRIAVDSLVEKEIDDSETPTPMDAVPEVSQGYEQALLEGARIVRQEPEGRSVRTALRKLLGEKL
jgi:hypothetical protein